MDRIPEGQSIEAIAEARRFNQIMSKGMVQQEYKELAHTLTKMSLPENPKILDIGTGTGFVALALARCLSGSPHVVGLDMSEAMLSLASENAHSQHLEDKVSWKLGDARSIPFADGEFDAVISSGSLHHWQEPQKIFNEIARVLKPEGKILVRDSKRITTSILPRLLATLIGLTLPPDFRKHYWGSIYSSYTTAELSNLIENSFLKGCRIQEDLLDLMIIKE